MATKTKAKKSSSTKHVVIKTSNRYGRLTPTQVKQAVAAVSRKSK